MGSGQGCIFRNSPAQYPRTLPVRASITYGSLDFSASFTAGFISSGLLILTAFAPIDSAILTISFQFH